MKKFIFHLDNKYSSRRSWPVRTNHAVEAYTRCGGKRSTYFRRWKRMELSDQLYDPVAVPLGEKRFLRPLAVRLGRPQAGQTVWWWIEQFCPCRKSKLVVHFVASQFIGIAVSSRKQRYRAGVDFMPCSETCWSNWRNETFLRLKSESCLPVRGLRAKLCFFMFTCLLYATACL
jgi:hypothetical protein